MNKLIYCCPCENVLVELVHLVGIYYSCPTCGKQIMYFYNQKNKEYEIKEVIMENKYVVDFYDGFDGWIGSKLYKFFDYNEAVEFCCEKMKEMSKDNIDFGEHYGVMKDGVEIFCGLDFIKRNTGEK